MIFTLKTPIIKAVIFGRVVRGIVEAIYAVVELYIAGLALCGIRILIVAIHTHASHSIYHNSMIASLITLCAVGF